MGGWVSVPKPVCFTELRLPQARAYETVSRWMWWEDVNYRVYISWNSVEEGACISVLAVPWAASHVVLWFVTWMKVTRVEIKAEQWTLPKLVTSKTKMIAAKCWSQVTLSSDESPLVSFSPRCFEFLHILPWIYSFLLLPPPLSNVLTALLLPFSAGDKERREEGWRTGGHDQVWTFQRPGQPCVRPHRPIQQERYSDHPLAVTFGMKLWSLGDLKSSSSFTSY